MTIAKQLQIKKFPFIIKDYEGNEIYREDSDGYWSKRKYEKGKQIYFEDTHEYWSKKDYDEWGNQIYYETINGVVFDRRKYELKEPKPLPEYTMEELVNKLGHNFKIKK
jgi:hypothetical protein